MENLDIFILILFIIPVIRKILFWAFVVQLKGYRYDRFLEYLLSPEGKKAIFNSWDIAELFLFFLFMFFIFTLRGDYFLVLTLMGLLILENCYALYKLFRRLILKPIFTSRMVITIVLTIVLNILLLIGAYYTRFFYPAMLLLLSNEIVIIYFAVIFSLPVVVNKKGTIIKEAKQKFLGFKKIKKVGITGSFGKTSTKEFLNSIFAQQYKVIATPENINSEMGISYYILRNINKEVDYFFCEMGAYKIGEIALLGDIVGHKYGFLTGIGNQHIGLFGGINNIVRAKFEIVEKIIENKGILYCNFDNYYIQNYDFPSNLNYVSYGLENEDVKAKSTIFEIKDAKTIFELEYKRRKYQFKTNVIGKHNILNLTGVLAFALDQGVDIDLISQALGKLKMPKNTLEVKYLTKDQVLIDDTYNASVDGVIAGVEVLDYFKGIRILVLDDVLELGLDSDKIHYDLGKQIAVRNLDRIILIGRNYKSFIAKGLLDGGYKIENLDVGNKANFLDEIKKHNGVVLFEGRKARLVMDGMMGD